MSAGEGDAALLAGSSDGEGDDDGEFMQVGYDDLDRIGGGPASSGAPLPPHATHDFSGSGDAAGVPVHHPYMTPRRRRGGTNTLVSSSSAEASVANADELGSEAASTAGAGAGNSQQLGVPSPGWQTTPATSPPTGDTGAEARRPDSPPEPIATTLATAALLEQQRRVRSRRAAAAASAAAGPTKNTALYGGAPLVPAYPGGVSAAAAELDGAGSPPSQNANGLGPGPSTEWGWGGTARGNGENGAPSSTPAPSILPGGGSGAGDRDATDALVVQPRLTAVGRDVSRHPMPTSTRRSGRPGLLVPESAGPLMVGGTPGMRRNGGP